MAKIEQHGAKKDFHKIKKCAHNFALHPHAGSYCTHCSARINSLGGIELFCVHCNEKVTIRDGKAVSFYDWKTEECGKSGVVR